MTTKIKIFITLSFIIIGIMFYLLNESQRTNNIYNDLNKKVLYGEINQYMSNLYNIKETLKLFKENFNEKENELYHQSLNHTYMNLNHLSSRAHYLTDNIYKDGKDYLHYAMVSVNRQLNKVDDIEDKQKSQAIIYVIEQYYREMESLSYEEVTKVEGIDKITNILYQLSEEIEMILNES